jgi:hypothetical protein
MHNPLNIYTPDAFEAQYRILKDYRSYFIHDIALNYEFQVKSYTNPTLEDSIVFFNTYILVLVQFIRLIA